MELQALVVSAAVEDPKEVDNLFEVLEAAGAPGSVSSVAVGELAYYLSVFQPVHLVVVEDRHLHLMSLLGRPVVGHCFE